MGYQYLLTTARPARLDAIPALDDIGLQRDGTRTAVQLQKETTGIAEDGARLIAPPERGGAGGAVLADRLSRACQCEMLRWMRCDGGRWLIMLR